ncbi:fatty acid desaturase domain-containing protein [Phthorimaea operculella]|nr:fatty acid desaturase domain-containing protein [Phthorimaea operculella]
MTNIDNIAFSRKQNKVYEIIEARNIKSKVFDKDCCIVTKDLGTDFTYKHEIIWTNAFFLGLIHVLGLWGLKILLTGGIGWKSFIWALSLGYLCTGGVIIGAHRYFTHKSFKATPLLRAILLLSHTIAGQNSMFTWSRDHRLHHRYSDTDGDPHNATRGFFFAHVGWLLTKKHPYVVELGRRIDMSDLKADWMVMFQKKYYGYLYFVLAFFIPIWVPIHYFGETLYSSFFVCYAARYMVQLNGTWLVNSMAHLYGTRPYDKSIQPVESWFISLLSLGEGSHNYHHAFPWDYKGAELSNKFNIAADIIKFFETVGLAYELKTVSSELVKNRVLRTGDGTHFLYGTDEARAGVTAIGPVHPLNPSYNVTYPPPSWHFTANKTAHDDLKKSSETAAPRMPGA